jgi:hypothetical protein
MGICVGMAGCADPTRHVQGVVMGHDPNAFFTIPTTMLLLFNLNLYIIYYGPVLKFDRLNWRVLYHNLTCLIRFHRVDFGRN